MHKQCIRSNSARTLSFKMAPHRKSIKALQRSSNSTLDKENNYLRSLSDYQARVRRRESIRNYKNVAYDLERKIELEIKIKEGSARLLAAAQHPAQSLEAARALFTSNERMSTYMTELQHRGENASFKTNISESNGKLSISDFRFPLMWRDSDHFKNRGDYRRFAVFCLARVGAEVQDTSLLYPIDREQTDISFPDTLLFNNVPAEFELTLEIYSHVLQEDLSIASTPRKIRKSIHSSISKTVGRKLGASLRDQNDATKTPKFDLLAYAKMTLDDTDNNVRSHDLTLNSFDNKAHALPLFGHFCCRLAVKPNFIDKQISAEFVIINNQRYWTQLRNFQIEAWKSKKLAEKLEKPTYTICVNRDTLVQRSKSINNRLRITNQIDGAEKHDLMELDSKEDLQRWLQQLTTRIMEHSKWKHAAINLQQIPCSENLNKHANTRNCLVDDKLRGSIYDNTMSIDNTYKQMQRLFR